MEQAGIENMSAYIRKMVIDGYVVKLDLPELRELTLQDDNSLCNDQNIFTHLLQMVLYV